MQNPTMKGDTLAEGVVDLLDKHAQQQQQCKDQSQQKKEEKERVVKLGAFTLCGVGKQRAHHQPRKRGHSRRQLRKLAFKHTCLEVWFTNIVNTFLFSIQLYLNTIPFLHFSRKKKAASTQAVSLNT
jgi:hypothetical protein